MSSGTISATASGPPRSRMTCSKGGILDEPRARPGGAKPRPADRNRACRFWSLAASIACRAAVTIPRSRWAVAGFCSVAMNFSTRVSRFSALRVVSELGAVRVSHSSTSAAARGWLSASRAMPLGSRLGFTVPKKSWVVSQRNAAQNPGSLTGRSLTPPNKLPSVHVPSSPSRRLNARPMANAG